MRICPHLWKTEISIAATLHLAAATPNCDYIEFLPSKLAESGIRKDLTDHRLTMADGVLPLPAEPGLGIELNRDALAAYRSEAEALFQ